MNKKDSTSLDILGGSLSSVIHAEVADLHVVVGSVNVDIKGQLRVLVLKGLELSLFVFVFDPTFMIFSLVVMMVVTMEQIEQIIKTETGVVVVDLRDVVVVNVSSVGAV